MRRRDYLVLAGGSMTAAIAGCSGNDDDGSDGGSTDGTTDDTDQSDDGGETDDGGQTDDGGEEQPAPAVFEVSNVSLGQATVAAGASVELTATVTNTGEQSATKTVELRQAGNVVASQDVQLDGGGEQTVTFEPDTDLELGEYEFTLLTEDSEGTVTLTVAEGNFVVENLSPATAEVQIGEQLTISATVVNDGPVEDTKDVELRIDGGTLLKQEVTLAAGADQSVEFSGVDTSGLSTDVEQHSVWTPDDEATGVLTLLPVETGPGTLQLNVVDADGVAIGGASVTGDGIDETTNSDGVLTLELEAGDYDLTITSGELEATQTVTIEADETTSATVELAASATGAVSSFDGINSSGFTAFAEDNESGARENGISFPPGDVIINGDVSDGEWTSTNVEFKELTVSGFSVQVEAVNGFSGTFDEEAGLMTVEGELMVTVGGDQSFSYSIAATTGESGALTGSADFNSESGTATIVDNEYTVNDSTDDAVLNSVLGLPVEEPGRAWIELAIDFDFQRA